MSGHESEEPSYDSVFGREVPSSEEVHGEVYADTADELADSPAVPEFKGKAAEPVQHQPAQEQARKKEPTSVLQDALKGRSIYEILPQLSEEERNMLALRFELSSGRRLISQRRAADEIGMDRNQFRKKETELLDQISYLADKDLPGEEAK